MSTGDQSEYMRGKMAERGTSEGVQFSKDGFDRWAESTAPARAGQMEKEPAETQMVRTGGSMSVAEAKKFAQKIAKKYGQQVTDMVQYTGGAMRGGRSVNIAGVNIEIPDIVDKALDYGEKVLNFALLLQEKLPEIKQAIQEEIIENDADPSITADDKKAAQAMLPILDDILKYLTMLKNIKGYADVIANALKGKGSGRCGGAAQPTLVQRFQAAVKYIGEKAQQLLGYVSFFTRNAPFLKQMLKLRPLRPYGQQILDKINPILAIVGLGKGGRRKQTCECSDSEEYHSPSRKPMRGGFFPGMDNMFGQQKQEATMMPMQGDYGMIGGPVSQGMQSGYKGSPMRNEGMQMDNYDMSTGKYESTYNPPPVQEVPEDSLKMKKLMRQLDDLKRQIAESDSDEERTRLKKRYVALDEKIREMQLRGGMELVESVPNNEELIKRIKAEINRLKDMPKGRYSTLSERRIQELESQLKQIMKRGGTVYRPSTTSSKGGVVYNPREPTDTVVTSKAVGGSVSSRARKAATKAAKAAADAYAAATSRPVGGRKPSARGAIVKKVMKERGLSLPEASRYVKENGLY